jgi:hypothetical protein
MFGKDFRGGFQQSGSGIVDRLRQTRVRRATGSGERRSGRDDQG